jgi:Fe-S-cluster-containing hydrogenase component 2
MEKKIVVNDSKCTGCRLCELICSALKVGEFKPTSSRIKVVSDSRTGISTPKVCLQCEEPWCQAVCANSAIERNSITGAITISEEKCNGCQECIDACPYGCIEFDDMVGIAVKCDLCNANPRCVEVCYPKAIEYKTN